MKTSVTWVVVADGTQAKVFAHKGAGTGLSPVPDLMFEDEVKKAGDIMADRPGRSFSSGSDSRSAMEYSTDPVEVREERFVREVTEALERGHQQSAFNRLVIAAAPAALGTFRKLMSDQLKDSVVAELPKNLTKLPTPEIESHLDGILAM